MTSWPPYPPPAPPRPPKPWYRNVWVWVWVYVGIVAAAGVAAVASVLVFPFAFFPSDPLVEDSYYVDQGSVNRAVEQPCDEMMTAATEIQIFSTPSVGAASLHHFADVGRGIPAAIDSVSDANGDALKWRDDWNKLLDALDAYADKLANDREGTFDMPMNGDGEPVTFEMSGASDVWCEVPPIIEALDPHGEDY